MATHQAHTCIHLQTYTHTYTRHLKRRCSPNSFPFFTECTSRAICGVCAEAAAIVGTADLRLQNGLAEDIGYTQTQCASECQTQLSCSSYVFRQSDGYCELWTRSAGVTEIEGFTHCVVRGKTRIQTHILFAFCHTYNHTLPFTP